MMRAKIPLEPEESKVITTRSHLTFVVRDVLKIHAQWDHFIVEHR